MSHYGPVAWVLGSQGHHHAKALRLRVYQALAIKQAQRPDPTTISNGTASAQENAEKEGTTATLSVAGIRNATATAMTHFTYLSMFRTSARVWLIDQRPWRRNCLYRLRVLEAPSIVSSVSL